MENHEPNRIIAEEDLGFLYHATGCSIWQCANIPKNEVRRIAGLQAKRFG